MNLLRKNLFRILVLVAGLGIADNAFAQEGPGTRMGSMDGTIRTQKITLPFIRFGAVISTTSIATGSDFLRGTNGHLISAPHTSGSALAWSHTLTTSIAPMAYPARVVFGIFPLANQVGCTRLEVDGLDQYGRQVGPGGVLPRYTFGPLISNAPHTSSIAFSQITRIRVSGCFAGASCTNPGVTCSTAPAADSKLRVDMTRHIGLPFRAKSLASIQQVCIFDRVGAAVNGSGTYCFRNDAVTRSESGFASGAWLTYNATRNTLSFPNVYTTTARRTILDSVTNTSGQQGITLVDRQQFVITYKADIRTE